MKGIHPGEVVANSSFEKLQDGSKIDGFNGKATRHIELRQTRHESIPHHLFCGRSRRRLLMAAILLAGIVAYRQLPVSALPQVDYPTIQVLTQYPGASPDVMASTVTAPLERQFGADAGSQPDDLHQFRWNFRDRFAVQSGARYRCRGRRSTIGNQRFAELPAFRFAGASRLQQNQSRGCADSYARHHIKFHTAVEG